MTIATVSYLVSYGQITDTTKRPIRHRPNGLLHQRHVRRVLVRAGDPDQRSNVAFLYVRTTRTGILLPCSCTCGRPGSVFYRCRDCRCLGCVAVCVCVVRGERAPQRPWRRSIPLERETVVSTCCYACAARVASRSLVLHGAM